MEHRRPLWLRLPSNAALAPNIGCCNALLGAYVRAEVPQWQKVWRVTIIRGLSSIALSRAHF